MSRSMLVYQLMALAQNLPSLICVNGVGSCKYFSSTSRHNVKLCQQRMMEGYCQRKGFSLSSSRALISPGSSSTCCPTSNPDSERPLQPPAPVGPSDQLCSSGSFAVNSEVWHLCASPCEQLSPASQRAGFQQVLPVTQQLHSHPVSHDCALQEVWISALRVMPALHICESYILQGSLSSLLTSSP